jgi:hypothetical protein
MSVFLAPIGNGEVFLNPPGSIAGIGLPANGGFINTYLAGTTTPAATYTTSAGNVANSQPIVLTPAGMAPFEIWLLGGQAYKFIITDINGVQIGPTYDNLSGIGDPSSPSISKGPFYATAFGVVADGVTDDTAAWQAAINAVTSIRNATNSGGILIAPTGFSIISSALTVNGPIIIQGQGAATGTGAGNSGGCTIRTNSTSADVFTCTTAQAVVFRDLSIDTSVVKLTGNGISIIQTGANINTHSIIQNCRIVGMFDGISLSNCANYTIRDNFIQDFSNEGIYHTVNSTVVDLGDAIIEGNTIWDFNVTTADACIRFDPGAAVNVIGNKLLSANYGVRLTVSQGPTGTLNIVGNSIEQQNTSCITIAQSVLAKTYGNICIASNELSISGIAAAQSAISIIAGGGGAYLKNVSITGNVCNMNITQANPIISVRDGSGVSIIGNVVNNNGTVGASAGIDVGGNATNVVIDANKVINMGGGATYTSTAAVFMQPGHVQTFSSGGNTVAAASTVYLGTANSQATEGDAQFYVPYKCKAFRMFVNASAAPGAGQTFTYTLRVGGVASTLTVVNNSSVNSDVQDVTDVVSIPAPDGPSTASRISLQLVTSAAAAVTLHRVTVMFARDD